MFSWRHTSLFDFPAVNWSCSASVKFNAILCVFGWRGSRLRLKLCAVIRRRGRGYWLLSAQVMNFSLTVVIWFAAVLHPLRCGGILLTFHPHFLLQWAFAVTRHKLGWQFECERKNSPSKEIAVPQPWVRTLSAVTSLPWERTLSLWAIWWPVWKEYATFMSRVWGYQYISVCEHMAFGSEMHPAACICISYNSSQKHNTTHVTDLNQNELNQTLFSSMLQFHCRLVVFCLIPLCNVAMHVSDCNLGRWNLTLTLLFIAIHRCRLNKESGGPNKSFCVCILSQQ